MYLKKDYWVLKRSFKHSTSYVLYFKRRKGVAFIAPEPIGHFRVALCLYVKASVFAKTTANMFRLHVHFHRYQTNFMSKVFHVGSFWIGNLEQATTTSKRDNPQLKPLSLDYTSSFISRSFSRFRKLLCRQETIIHVWNMFFRWKMNLFKSVVSAFLV